MGAATDLVRRYAELYNDGSADDYGSDDFLQLYAEDVDWAEAPTAFTPQGRSGDIVALREATAFGRSMFRDRRNEIDEILEDGNRVVWIGTWSATVGVDGLPLPIGTRLRVPMAMLIEVREGLIVRQRDFVTSSIGG